MIAIVTLATLAALFAGISAYAALRFYDREPVALGFGFLALLAMAFTFIASTPPGSRCADRPSRHSAILPAVMLT